ncbi:hypothetical protein BN1708_018831, partial [Verticillium longisporum]
GDREDQNEDLQARQSRPAQAVLRHLRRSHEEPN